MKIISGFEATRIITKEDGLSKNRDVYAGTYHYSRYKEDLQLVKDAGITLLRVAVPWHRIEWERGKYDWGWMDDYMQALSFLGIEPILDPLHHVSIPSWLKGGFLDELFVNSYCKFFAMVFNRYKCSKYTIVNEPLVTTYFCTNAGIWFPYKTGEDNFQKGLDNIVKIIKTCSEYLQANNKEHWYIDAVENHYGTCESSIAHADYKNGWKFSLLDRLIAEGVKIDVLGLDYYAHCEFEWGAEGRKETTSPIGFAQIAKSYKERYNLPIALTETNIRGFIPDRQTWFKYMYQQCEEVGIDILCWYPFIDSIDWDSLLCEYNRNIDPVGIVWLDKDFNRNTSEFYNNIKMLNYGEISIKDVKSYKYELPLSEQLKGFK